MSIAANDLFAHLCQPQPTHVSATEPSEAVTRGHMDPGNMPMVCSTHISRDIKNFHVLELGIESLDVHNHQGSLNRLSRSMFMLPNMSNEPTAYEDPKPHGDYTAGVVRLETT
ncbi:hypothetical protein B0O80DRAFT_420795 [Mortierella sp. GBAus27b]|nr:hypothetical protein B0O80DRAFT_420795 [Mortierella sp. GBAus27b]